MKSAIASQPKRGRVQAEMIRSHSAVLAHQRELLGVVVVASVALRVLSALLQGDTVTIMPGVYDQVSYDTLARQVVAGHGFTFPSDWWPFTRAGEPTAHWSFLYTLYLAGVYTIFGPHPLVARLLQSVFAGVVLPLILFRLARRVFSVPVGLLAAALSAAYAYFVYYAGALMTETFYILAILWALDLAIEIGNGRSKDTWRWILLGLALATAGLLRQVFLLFVPALVVWLFWRARLNSKQFGVALPTAYATLRGLMFTALVVVVLFAPWTVRNYTAFGRFVPLNTNSGYAFFWGNNPVYGTNFVPILPTAVYQSLIPVELRKLDEAALDSALLGRGIGFVLDDPGRYVLLSVSRIKDYFQFWPSTESNPISNVARLLSFGLYLPFMLYGLLGAVLKRGHVGPDQWSPVLLLISFVALYSLVHLLTWALIRYRLPVDAVLMPFAAVGLLNAFQLFRHHSTRAVS
jgi:4-amino-4-deoxy-L-arabinose transferase-like glycosyltransferase